MEGKSEFYTRHEKELTILLKKIKEELLYEVIPFWEKRVVDETYPGYLNYFDRGGNLFDTKNRGGLWGVPCIRLPLFITPFGKTKNGWI